MRKIFMLLLMFSNIIYISCSRKYDTLSDLKSLIEAERAFSKLSETKGMRDAFMTYLAEGSLVFRPIPEDGHKAYASSPEVPGMLLWQPVYADIAAAGDIGYTTGPWEFRKEGINDKPTVFGHFVSIWQKQSDDNWRVLIDVGISHPMLQDSVIMLRYPLDNVVKQKGKHVSIDISAEKEVLLEEDKVFSTTSIAEGFANAFKLFTATEVRLYRPNYFPFIGQEAAIAALNETSGTLSWEPSVSNVALSGDLGYTLGFLELRADAATLQPDQRFSYLRIWKKQHDETWKVVLDICNPIPIIAER